MLRWLAPVLVLASLLLACADEDLATPAPTEAATAATAEVPTATVEAATPVPTIEPYATGLWLVDVATGDVHHLHDGRLDAGGEFPSLVALGFLPGGNQVQLRLGEAAPVVYDLDGRVVQQLDGILWRQTSTDGRLESWWDVVDRRLHVAIDGVELPEDVTWAEVAGPRAVLRTAGDLPETYNLEVLDLEGGQRRALATDVQVVCCHGAPAAISPEGGFYFNTDPEASYLYDLESLEVTNLGAPWFYDTTPAWAPGRDLLLVPNEVGEATVLDPASSERLTFDGSTWPVKWSAGGAYVYWGEAKSTVIADAATGERLATWEGHPSAFFWDGRVPVTDTEGGPAALLTTDAGTWVHHPALDAPLLIADADGGTWSPDASHAAIAVRTPSDPPALQRWDIVVLNADGSSRVVATDAQSSFLPPDLWWNEAGTHLLIRFPGGEWP